MKHLIILSLSLLLSAGAVAKGFVTHVTVTTYNPVRSQCDDTPNVTADGTRINHRALKSGSLRLVAVSRDLLAYMPYGSRVLVEGHGEYTVADTMHKRWNHRIDILLHPSQKGFKKEKVKVKVISKPKKEMKQTNMEAVALLLIYGALYVVLFI